MDKLGLGVSCVSHKQDIIVIGASAGGVEALKLLVSGLPRNLQAAIFVVLHIGRGSNGNSFLPEILNGAGPLSAVQAGTAEQIQHGLIYVAKPDCHMILEDGRVRSIYGPKENRTRPAINPLFRSAAAAYGPRVSGVILTGMLDDGVAGLAEIKRKGGVAVIQDPATAQFPSMPQNAIKHIQSDFIAPVEEIAGIVVRLATSERIARSWEDPMERLLLENQCPECAGPLWEERQGAIVQYRCRVGHAFSPLALKEEEQDAVEKSIWASIIKLENAAALSERLISELGEEAARDSREKREQAQRLKKMLMEPSTED